MMHEHGKFFIMYVLENDLDLTGVDMHACGNFRYID